MLGPLVCLYTRLLWRNSHTSLLIVCASMGAMLAILQTACNSASDSQSLFPLAPPDTSMMAGLFASQAVRMWVIIISVSVFWVPTHFTVIFISSVLARFTNAIACCSAALHCARGGELPVRAPVGPVPVHEGSQLREHVWVRAQ